MYKVGDRVETYKEIRSLRGWGPRGVKGQIVEVHTSTLVILFDESWPCGARQLVFLTADLLATDVLRLKVGDKVKTNQGHYGVIADGHFLRALGIVHVTVGNVTHGYSLRKLTKVDDPDEGGQRWSFKSNKDTFDGARVIRELLNAGADYAVVTVGGAKIGLLHERLAKRAEVLGLYCLVGFSWGSRQLATLAPGLTQRMTPAVDVAVNGYRHTTAESLAELAAMVAELEKKEAEVKQFVTHVEWGKASLR